MKKQKFNKKLYLNKETISNLDKIKGGACKDTISNCPQTTGCTMPPPCNSDELCWK